MHIYMLHVRISNAPQGPHTSGPIYGRIHIQETWDPKHTLE
jgi:hypothetical protein